MNNLMKFENYNVEVFEYQGKVLFNPKDVSEILGIADVNSSIRNFNNNQVIKLKNSDMHEMHIRKLNNAGENFLTESGVYKLIFKSHKEEAERFQDWVTDDVLPQLRKSGAYSISKPLSAMDQLKLQYQVLATHEEKINEVSVKVNNLEQSMTIDHGQAVNVKYAVDSTVRRLCCGNESNAYMNKKLRSRVYRYVWKNIKDYFNITAYHNLLRKDVDVCINYINTLALQGALLREVQQENSQMCMGV